MSRFYPQTSPAFRGVDSGGNVIRGPHRMGMLGGAGPVNGLYVVQTRVRYVPVELGPVTFATWEEAPILIGYRVEVELDFGVIEFDQAFSTGSFGYGLLENYFALGMSQSSYAPLQFNLYGDVTSIWRGMYPTTPFNPQPAEGKETSAASMTLGLRSRALLSDLAALSNAWETFQW